MKNKSLILMLTTLVGAVLVTGAVLLWAPVCSAMLNLESGKQVHMKCFYTGQVSLQLALLMAATAVTAFFSRYDGWRMQWITVAIGLLLILNTLHTPLSIGVCMMKMDCHQTVLWIRIGGALGILSALIGIFTKNQPLLNVKE